VPVAIRDRALAVWSGDRLGAEIGQRLSRQADIIVVLDALVQLRQIDPKYLLRGVANPRAGD
jgi:energy-converting hydrogenase Eha subunit B